jgi:hypothetical protein
MKICAANLSRELFTTKGRILWGLVPLAGVKVRLEVVLSHHSPFQSAGDTVGLPWSLVRPRAYEKPLACRIVHNDVLAGDIFCENSDARFGSLKVFRPLNPMGVAVQSLLENIEWC